MGKFEPPFSYTGSVRNLSVYNVRGSDKPIVRTKGGPTKRQIKTKPSFDVCRRNNKEFGGRARMASQVMDILRPLKYLGDYNIAGPLNSLFIPIQTLDTVSEFGQRTVELTKNPGILQGFLLNRRTAIETIIANPLDYTLSKKTLTGTITIPELIPGINFFVPGQFSWYKFIAVFGVIQDLFYHPDSREGYLNKAGDDVRWTLGLHRETDWLNLSAHSPAITIECSLKSMRKDVQEMLSLDSHSCLLGIGIAFGNMPRGQVEMIKYVGGAKVLGMG
ncbi:MAG TPA: hypothetical protein VIM79_11430 [Niastella sp.]